MLALDLSNSCNAELDRKTWEQLSDSNCSNSASSPQQLCLVPVPVKVHDSEHVAVQIKKYSDVFTFSFFPQHIWESRSSSAHWELPKFQDVLQEQNTNSAHASFCLEWQWRRAQLLQVLLNMWGIIKKKSTEYLHAEKSVTMGKIFISAVSSVVPTEAKCQKIRNPEDWIN